MFVVSAIFLPASHAVRRRCTQSDIGTRFVDILSTQAVSLSIEARACVLLTPNPPVLTSQMATPRLYVWGAKLLSGAFRISRAQAHASLAVIRRCAHAARRVFGAACPARALSAASLAVHNGGFQQRDQLGRRQSGEGAS